MSKAVETSTSNASASNSMLQRLTAKAQGFKPRTVATGGDSASSSGGARVTPQQLEELVKQLAALKQELEKQETLLKTLSDSSEAQSKSHSLLKSSQQALESKIALLEKEIISGTEKSTEAVSSISEEVRAKVAELNTQISQADQANKQALAPVVKKISDMQLQQQKMFDSLITAMAGSNLSQNDSAIKLEELMKAYSENKNMDMDELELKIAVKNIDTAIEQSVLAKEAGFLSTEKTLLQLGLQIAETISIYYRVDEMNKLIGEIPAE